MNNVGFKSRLSGFRKPAFLNCLCYTFGIDVAGTSLWLKHAIITFLTVFSFYSYRDRNLVM